MCNIAYCRQVFLEAIRKAAQDNPELSPNHSGVEGADEDVYEMLTDFIADGDGSPLVFMAGREFAGKVLENIPNPESFEVCALVRDAIERGCSIKGNYGINYVEGENFQTPAYKQMMELGRLQAEVVPA